MFNIKAGADPGFGVGGGRNSARWSESTNYYCLRCLWDVWCRKIKIDLQVIMVIWGEETERTSLLSLCFLSSPFIFLCLFEFFLGGGANVPSAPSESASGKHILTKCHHGFNRSQSPQIPFKISLKFYNVSMHMVAN